MIRLEPMDADTYETWREDSIREYAQEEVDAGTWPAAEALERSARSYAELLPNGLATAGHELRSMVNEDGERVGYAWFVPEDRPISRIVYIYDIAVDPEHRRRATPRPPSARSRPVPDPPAASASSSTSSTATPAHGSSTGGPGSSRRT